MPTNYALVRNERLYLTKESASAYGTAVAATNSNCCRHTAVEMKNEVALLIRPEKTGTRSQTVGVLGRKYATWTVRTPVTGSGVTGTLPDCDPLLYAAFGKTATAGTAITYTLSDTIPSINIWSFRTPTTIAQRGLLGAVCGRAEWTLGPNFAESTYSGEGLWVIDSEFWASADATQKGGTTAMPTEPAAPTTAGVPVIGFTGSITTGTDAIADIRNMTISIATLNQTVKDTFGSYYPTQAEGDTREVTVAFDLYEADVVGQQNLRIKSKLKTAFDVSAVLGTAAGNTWTFTVKNLQIDDPAYGEGQRRYTNSFTGRAFATSLTALDELKLVIS